MSRKDFKSKKENGFLFFQIGLIAVMVIALLVLEYNFESFTKKQCVFPIPDPDPSEVNVDYRIIRDVPVNQPKTNKVVAKVVLPKQLPENLNKIVINNNVEQSQLPVDLEGTNTENPISDNKSKGNENDSEGNTEGESNNHTVISVEQLPMFKECEGLERKEQLTCFQEQLMKRVAKKVNYPTADFEDGKEGRVFVEFIIDEFGNFIEAHSLDRGNATKEMKEEAEKVFKKMPKLIPAKQGKKNVRIKYVIPITFKINK